MKTITPRNPKKTKKVLLTAVVMAAIASAPVSAYEVTIESKQTNANKRQEKLNKENIGFGTGALIGGIIAGPFGAFFAGVGGSLIAKYNNINDENEALALN